MVMKELEKIRCSGFWDTTFLDEPIMSDEWDGEIRLDLALTLGKPVCKAKCATMLGPTTLDLFTSFQTYLCNTAKLPQVSGSNLIWWTRFTILKSTCLVSIPASVSFKVACPRITSEAVSMNSSYFAQLFGLPISWLYDAMDPLTTAPGCTGWAMDVSWATPKVDGLSSLFPMKMPFWGYTTFSDTPMYYTSYRFNLGNSIIYIHIYNY